MDVSNHSVVLDRPVVATRAPVDKLLTSVPCDFVEWDGRWKLSHRLWGSESTEFARVYNIGGQLWGISQSGLYYRIVGSHPSQSDEMMGCKYCDRFLPTFS